MAKDFLTKHRGIIIFLFVVPFSFIFQKIQDLRNWFYRTFKNTNRLHNRNVSRICDLVKSARSENKKMCTARAPWKTMSIRKATYKDDMVKIPLNLKNILDLDEDSMTLRVEPMVTMGDITHYLIPKGYALAVQVEMDDLTVGGLCMGIGIETSSHKYGFLFETIKAYEIITAEGELVRATRDENTDLFHALPMSHGTLGFLVAVELEIVPVKRYMKLSYYPCHTREEFSKKITELSTGKSSPSFVEGLFFNSSEGVAMAGEFVDKVGEDGRYNPINRWYKPWFHTHAETFLKSGEGVEYIPLRHYFHRHTPSVFFQLKDLIPFANKSWYRWFFGWLGAPKISLMKYTMTKTLRKRAFQNRVAQDIIVPISNISEAIKYSDENYEIYPLWVCPVRIFDHGRYEGIIRNPVNVDQYDSEMYFDLGIYGIPPAVKEGKWNSIKQSRALEEFTRNRNGFHMLYADIFMTHSEFEQMFSHTLYRAIRSKYSAEDVFPEIYEKVIPEKWLINLESLEQDKEVVMEE